jgi:2-desacetyl-2-hydroxyethyl bacteriochlorophyllide A dehydrogenase
MKAVMLADVKRVEIQQIDEPLAEPDDVLIDVRAGGICGSDMHAYRGHHPFRKPPVVLGHEVSGRVLAVGPAATRVRVGDKVAVEPQISCGLCVECVGGLPNLCKTTRRPGHGWGGTFAERIVAPESVVYRLDDARSYEEGALVEPAAVAYRAVSRSNIGIAERVVVLGAGPIGALIALIVQQAAPELLVVTDIKDYNLELMRSIKIEHAIDVGDREADDIVADLTGGSGFDTVLVTSSSSRGLLDAVRLVRPGGTIVQVAIYGEPIPLDATGAVLREARIVPSLTYTPEDFRRTVAMINTGALDVRPLITHRYNLDQASEVFEAMDAGMDHVKVILELEGT